jgi:hypothetical protein
MADSNSPTAGEITAMAGGGVAVLFSFFDMVGTGDFGVSAWGSGIGLFPVATLMAIFSVAVAVQVALERFAGVKGEPRFANLTWTQVDLLFAFFAVVLALSYLIVDTNGVDRKIGYWGMAIGSVATFVGTILMVRERMGRPDHTPPPA